MSTMMYELYWAAGFIEGEGHFSGQGIGRSSHIVGAGQKDAECLERLQRLFGGKIYRNASNGMHSWTVQGSAARGVMMTLYPLMSVRRQTKIRGCLLEWKDHIPTRGKHSRLKTHCKRGHLLSGENMWRDPKRGVRHCRACIQLYNKTQAAERKEARHQKKLLLTSGDVL